MTPSRSIDDLLAIMARLRDADNGCPWDLEQDFASIAPYTIEEAYEVADAIQRAALGDLRDELGDLLFQVVFHARMAEEVRAFDFGDVVLAVTDKMVRRHPHVFGDAKIDGAEAQTRSWEAMKAAERARKGGDTPPSVLDDVPVALPALARAVKLQKRAARVGFDWPRIGLVLDKLREELGEFEAELPDTLPPDAVARDRLEDELGDILFVLANIARHLDLDPETALRRTNAKFEHRFRHVETRLAARGTAPGAATLDEMEALWQEAKTTPTRSGGSDEPC